jgi:hypothetical protein
MPVTFQDLERRITSLEKDNKDLKGEAQRTKGALLGQGSIQNEGKRLHIDLSCNLSDFATKSQIPKTPVPATGVGPAAPAPTKPKRCVALSVFATDETVAVGDGTMAFPVPVDLNGYNLTDVLAAVYTKGVTGTTDVMIRRARAGTDVDMLLSAVSIGDAYYANNGTIDTSKDDVATGDLLFVDVDSVHSGTLPTVLSVVLTFTRP